MRAPRHFRAVTAVFAALAALTGAALPAGGCFDNPEVQLCGEIPAGGCPIGRGGSCDDTLCAGLYDCVEGKWTREVECSANGDGGSGGSGDAGPDAVCSPVTISHVGEASGCEPDLQHPDCPVAAAEAACSESVCLTGCIDFFLCTKDGWKVAAGCDDQGELLITP
jgi:hypothetical protein